MASMINNWEIWEQTSAKKKSSKHKIEILYQDHFGYWAPLQRMYWLEDERFMVSPHSESSVVETASTYCPSCFEISKADDTTCSQCLTCPVCFSLVITNCDLNGKFHLRCTHCYWDSYEFLVGTSQETLNDEIEKAMGVQTKSQLPSDDRVEGGLDQEFSRLLSHYSKPTRVHVTSNQQNPSWQPADADDVQDRKDKLLLISPDMVELRGIVPQCGVAVANPRTNLEQRHVTPANQPTSIHHLLPVRTQLRSKKDRRSVLVGRAPRGYLVKSKVHPLEGDSSFSLQKNKAQWWRIMKNAMQHVPRLTVKQFNTHRTDEDRNVLTLNLSHMNTFPIHFWVVDVSCDHLEVVPHDSDGLGATPKQFVTLEGQDLIEGSKQCSEVGEVAPNTNPIIIPQPHQEAVWLQVVLMSPPSSKEVSTIEVVFKMEFHEDMSKDDDPAAPDYFAPFTAKVIVPWHGQGYSP